jgi:hypothetical protein
MPVLAVAFHPDSALDRLHEYFARKDAQASATTQSGECSRCGLIFAVVLPQKFDPRNEESVIALCKLITENCDAGRHEEEYVLDTH